MRTYEQQLSGRQTMKCTIKEIARELGMSRNTVAKALSGKTGVSAKSKTMILEKAREMGYVMDDGRENPYEKDRETPSESNSRQNSILFLTRSSFNLSDFWIKVMKGMESVLKANQYNLLIGVMDDQDIQRLALPGVAFHRDVKGIVLVELCEQKICNEVLKLELPTVTVDMPKNYENFLGRLDIVTMENRIQIRKVVLDLIQKGCTRFAFAGNLSGSNVGRGFQERYEALCETLRQNGLSIMEDSSFLNEPDLLLMNPNFLINRIKALKELPEVYICGNDWTAIQFMNALQFLDYRIPQDISVVGFDDIQDASNVHPPLTTVRTDKEFLGIAAANCILDRIRHPNAPHVYAQYTTELVVRKSTI